MGSKNSVLLPHLTRAPVSAAFVVDLLVFPLQVAVVSLSHDALVLLLPDSHYPRRRVVWERRCNVNSTCASFCCFVCITHQTAEVSLPPTSKRACLLTPFPPSLSFRFLLLLPICSVSHTPCFSKLLESSSQEADVSPPTSSSLLCLDFSVASPLLPSSRLSSCACVSMEEVALQDSMRKLSHRLLLLPRVTDR